MGSEAIERNNCRCSLDRLAARAVIGPSDAVPRWSEAAKTRLYDRMFPQPAPAPAESRTHERPGATD